MNERIQELAQCNERIQNFFETGPVQRAAIEEFAELIVRECAQFIFVLDAEPVSHKSAAKMLQDHFGVK